MKNRKLTTLVVASSLLLPIAAFGQASGQTSTSSPEAGQERDSSQWQQDQSSQQAGASQQSQFEAREDKPDKSKTYSSSTQADISAEADVDADVSASDISASASFASSSDIRRVQEDQLENKVTAEQLIGKDVVDRNGEKVATVKDINLQAVLPGGFEQASVEASGEASSETYAASTGSDASSTMTRPQSSGSLSGSAEFDEQSRSASAQFGEQGAASSSDVEVYLSVGGLWGLGEEIVAVPVSKLSYDSQNDQLQIDSTQQEIAAIADPEQARGAEQEEEVDVTVPAE